VIPARTITAVSGKDTRETPAGKTAQAGMKTNSGAIRAAADFGEPTRSPTANPEIAKTRSMPCNIVEACLVAQKSNVD
jgi:hypothetical protein